MQVPGMFLFFGLQIAQDEPFPAKIHADHKLGTIDGFPIYRNRRKQIDNILNKIEMKAFKVWK